MYCKNCGAYVEDGVAFCSTCGTAEPVPGAQNVRQSPEQMPYAQPQYDAPYEQPQYGAPYMPPYGYPYDPYALYNVPVSSSVMDEAEEASCATRILVFGIIGLVLSCTFFLSIAGVVFSKIAKVRVANFVKKGGRPNGKTKAGSILAGFGLPVGIVLGVAFTIFCLANLG